MGFDINLFNKVIKDDAPTGSSPPPVKTSTTPSKSGGFSMEKFNSVVEKTDNFVLPEAFKPQPFESYAHKPEPYKPVNPETTTPEYMKDTNGLRTLGPRTDLRKTQFNNNQPLPPTAPFDLGLELPNMNMPGSTPQDLIDREAIALQQNKARDPNFGQTISSAGSGVDFGPERSPRERVEQGLTAQFDVIDMELQKKRDEEQAMWDLRRKDAEKIKLWEKMGAYKIGDSTPFVSGAAELVEVTKFSDAIYAIENNTETDEQLQFVNEYLEWSIRDETIPAQIFGVMAQMPAFYGEILATGPAYTGSKKFAIKGAEKLAKKYLVGVGREIIVKKMANRLSGKIALGLFGTAVRTPIAGSTNIAAGTVEKMIPDFEYYKDEQGQLKILFTGNDEGFGKALTKSIGESYIELASEKFGKVLPEIKAWKFMKDETKTQLIKVAWIKQFAKLNPSATLSDLNKLAKKAGWDGILEEMAEERVGDVGHGLLYEAGLGDQKWSLPSGEQLVVEIFAFGGPSISLQLLRKGISNATRIDPPTDPTAPEEKERGRTDGVNRGTLPPDPLGSLVPPTDNPPPGASTAPIQTTATPPIPTQSGTVTTPTTTQTQPGQATTPTYTEGELTIDNFVDNTSNYARDATDLNDFKRRLLGDVADMVGDNDYVEPIVIDTFDQINSLAKKIFDNAKESDIITPSGTLKGKYADEGAPIVLDENGNVLSGFSAIYDLSREEEELSDKGLFALKVSKKNKNPRATPNKLKLKEFYTETNRQGSLFPKKGTDPGVTGGGGRIAPTVTGPKIAKPTGRATTPATKTGRTKLEVLEKMSLEDLKRLAVYNTVSYKNGMTKKEMIKELMLHRGVLKPLPTTKKPVTKKPAPKKLDQEGKKKNALKISHGAKVANLAEKIAKALDQPLNQFNAKLAISLVNRTDKKLIADLVIQAKGTNEVTKKIFAEMAGLKKMPTNMAGWEAAVDEYYAKRKEEKPEEKKPIVPAMKPAETGTLASEELQSEFKKKGVGHNKTLNGFRELVSKGSISNAEMDMLLEIFMDTNDAFMHEVTISAPAQLKRPLGTFRYIRRRAFGQPDGKPERITIKLRQNLVRDTTHRNENPSSSGLMLPASTFIHEYGHYGHALLLNQSEKDIIEQVFRELGPRGRKAFFSKGLTGNNVLQAGYYSKNPNEFFAESFAEYVLSGKVADSKLLSIYERFKKRLIALLKTMAGRKSSEVDKLAWIYEKVLRGDQKLNQADIESLMEQEASIRQRMKPKPKEVKHRKIKHFTLKENIRYILEDGFDTSKDPIFGVKGRERGAATQKFGNNITYFTTDVERWNKAMIYKASGKLKELTAEMKPKKEDSLYFDYDKQKWMVEEGSLTSVDLTAVDATIKPSAKILEINSVDDAFKFFSDNNATFHKQRFVSMLTELAKTTGYDIVNLNTTDLEKWEDTSGRLKMPRDGSSNHAMEMTGNGGNNDYFIINQSAITLDNQQRGMPTKEYYRGTSKGNASRVDPGLDKWENPNDTVPKSDANGLKIYEEVKKLVRKYARTIGEGHLPSGTLGVFYTASKNIRIMSMNHLSVAAHEITHFLDNKNRITDQVMEIAGYSVDGKPKYDKATAAVRKELTDLYVEYYPGGNKTHKLRKRMKEGFAMLLQKNAEMPSVIAEQYPNLVKDFLTPRGKFYNPVMGEILTDLRDIVARYAALSDLNKVGATVADVDKGLPKGFKSWLESVADNIAGAKSVIDGKRFMNLREGIKTIVADEAYPVEKLSKKLGGHMTKDDPSLWIRQYKNVAGLVTRNITKKKRGFSGGGYWGWRNGDFKKILDFNWGNLVDRLEKEGATDSFAFWLVSRRAHFEYKFLDELKIKLDILAKQVRDVGGPQEASLMIGSNGKTLFEEYKEARTAHKDQAEIIKNDRFDRKVVRNAYFEHKESFAEVAKMYDTLIQEDLNFLHDETVGLVTTKEYNRLSQKEGYASFKREFYDEIVGRLEKGGPDTVNIGGANMNTRVSTMKRRTGSGRTIINPIYSGIRAHAEIQRKGMQQIVYNKMGKLFLQTPDSGLGQPLELKTREDKETGEISFPQERNSDIIMARIGRKRVPILIQNPQIMNTLTGILDIHSINAMEWLMIYSSRMFTRSTTSWFLGFPLSNFAVDQVTLQAQSRNKSVGLFGPIRELSKALNSNNVEQRYFQEYLNMGGERQTMNGWQNMSPNELVNAITKEATGLRKVAQTLDAGGELLGALGEASEVVSRATEYIRARKAGQPQIVAMEEAGRVTASFHHVGSWGSGKYGQGWVKSLPYFNASIQVLAQAAETLGTEEGRRQYAFVVLGVIAFQIGSLSMLMAMGSDDQKRQYRDLSAEELSRYIYFPNPTGSGKGLWKVRIPDQMAMFGTLINMGIAQNSELDPNYATEEYVRGATNWIPTQFNPVLLNGDDAVKKIMSIAPQLLKPGMLVAAGVKDYPKILPLESQGQKAKEPRYRYHKSTSWAAKKIGDQFNMSPIVLDALILGYFGRSAGYITGKKSAFYEGTPIPNFTSGFTQKHYEQYGRTWQNYYDEKERVEQVINTNKYGRDENITIKDQKKLVDALDKKSTINKINKLMKAYSKLDVEEYPLSAEIDRNEILDLMKELQ